MHAVNTTKRFVRTQMSVLVYEWWADMPGILCSLLLSLKPNNKAGKENLNQPYQDTKKQYKIPRGIELIYNN